MNLEIYGKIFAIRHEKEVAPVFSDFCWSGVKVASAGSGSSGMQILLSTFIFYIHYIHFGNILYIDVNLASFFTLFIYILSCLSSLSKCSSCERYATINRTSYLNLDFEIVYVIVVVALLHWCGLECLWNWLETAA